MKRQYIHAIGAVCALILLMINPESAVLAARNALRSWADAVAPSLFPFMLVTPALTSAELCALYRRALSRFMKPLFGVTGEGAAAVVVGWLAGSPSGVMALRDAAMKSPFSRGEYVRGALLASGASPAFYLSSISVGMLGMPQLGWLLLRSQWAAAIIAGLIFARLRFGAEPVTVPAESTSAQDGKLVLAAVTGTLAVAGYMTFFAVLARQIALPLGAAFETPILAILEFSGGCASLAASALPLSVRLPLISAVACVGSISSYAQVIGYIKPFGASGKIYLLGKLMQGGLAYAVTALQLRLMPLDMPVFASTPQSSPGVALPAAASAAALLLGGVGWYLLGALRNSRAAKDSSLRSE